MRPRYRKLASILFGFSVVTFATGLWMMTTPQYRMLGVVCVAFSMMEMMAALAVLKKK